MNKSDFSSPRKSASSTRVSTSSEKSFLNTVYARNELGILIAMATMVISMSIFRQTFLALDSSANVDQRAAWYGIMTLFVVFLLSMRDIDLYIRANHTVSIIAVAILTCRTGYYRLRRQNQGDLRSTLSAVEHNGAPILAISSGVACVRIRPRDTTHAKSNIDMSRVDIPNNPWAELKHEGVLPSTR